MGKRNEEDEADGWGEESSDARDERWQEKAFKEVTKREASYQMHPNGRRFCEICSMFRVVPGMAQGACTLVEGQIAPDGWCVYWEPRELGLLLESS